MRGRTKIRLLSTGKKDEAAFYLNELARGLLKDRVRIRTGDRDLMLDVFETIHLEMAASETKRRYALDIRLVWRKETPAAPAALGRGRLGSAPARGFSPEITDRNRDDAIGVPAAPTLTAVGHPADARRSLHADEPDRP